MPQIFSTPLDSALLWGGKSARVADFRPAQAPQALFVTLSLCHRPESAKN